jgi:hypothetical protein
MIKKETIQHYFEEELENFGRLTILLYRDKKLLKDGDYVTFAEELLSRSKKAYFATILMVTMFCMFGVLYISGSVFDLNSVYIGVLYLVGGFAGLHFATKEYYKIAGSMKLLLKLSGDVELKK